VILKQSFYQRDALDVARDLLGKELWRDDVGLRITEVEAYRGPWDTACHAKAGKTKRTAVMFGEAGCAYVYLIYGIHQMLNVVTRDPAAVLIRACEPVGGLDVIQERRGGKSGPVLLTGPGKIGAALDLDTSWSGHRVFETGGLELREGEPPESVLVGPRVGIDYAEPEHRDADWRLAVGGTRWVSVPKTLRMDTAG